MTKRRHELTDEQWAKLVVLLPPEKPRTGRPYSHYQLFNLADDPFEQRDRAASDPAELRRMMGGLITALELHEAVYPAGDDGKPLKPVAP